MLTLRYISEETWIVVDVVWFVGKASSAVKGVTIIDP